MKVSETLRLVLTLVIISVISAAALSIVYEITDPKIRENQFREMKATLERTLPEATAFDEPAIPAEILERTQGIRHIFVGYDQDRNLAGIAMVVEGAGYQDFIQLLVTVSGDLKEIKSVEILDQKETPGLGARIEEKEFLGQFKGEVKEEYDAITGATVSSTTIVNLVNKAIEDLPKIIESEGIKLGVGGEPVVEEEGTSEEEVDVETESSPEWNETEPELNQTEEEYGEESTV